VRAGKLRIKPGTVVKGTLFADVAEPFVAGNDVAIGEIKRAEREVPDTAALLKARGLAAGRFFLGTFLAGWLFIGLFPLRAGVCAANMRQSPFKSFAVGMLAALGALLMAAMLLGSGVGTTAGLVILGAGMLFGAAALPLAGLWLGAVALRTGGRAPAVFAIFQPSKEALWQPPTTTSQIQFLLAATAASRSMPAWIFSSVAAHAKCNTTASGSRSTLM